MLTIYSLLNNNLNNLFIVFVFELLLIHFILFVLINIYIIRTSKIENMQGEGINIVSDSTLVLITKTIFRSAMTVFTLCLLGIIIQDISINFFDLSNTYLRVYKTS